MIRDDANKDIAVEIEPELRKCLCEGRAFLFGRRTVDVGFRENLTCMSDWSVDSFLEFHRNASDSLTVGAGVDRCFSIFVEVTQQ